MNDQPKKILGLSERYFLILIFLVSFILRIAYTLFIRLHLDQPIINDETNYHAHALNLLQNSSYGFWCLKAYYPPVYPIFLFIIFKIYGVNIISVGIFNSLISSLISLFIYFTCKKIFNYKSSALASVIAVFCPYYVYYSPLLLPETLLTFLLLVSIFLLLKSRENHSYTYLILSSLFLGLSSLTNSIAIFLPTVVILYFLLQKEFVLKNFLKQSSVYLFIFFIALSPWAIRNYFAIGTPLFTNTNVGKTFLGGNHFFASRTDRNMGTYIIDQGEVIKEVGSYYCGKTELEVDKILLHAGFSQLKKNYERIPYMLSMKLIKFWSFRPNPAKEKWTRNDFLSLFTYGFIFLFFLVGFFKTFKPREKIFIFHLVIIYFTLVALVFWGNPRHRFPISPYYIILASAVMMGIWDSFRAKSKVK